MAVLRHSSELDANVSMLRNPEQQCKHADVQQVYCSPLWFRFLTLAFYYLTWMTAIGRNWRWCLPLLNFDRNLLWMSVIPRWWSLTFSSLLGQNFHFYMINLSIENGVWAHWWSQENEPFALVTCLCCVLSHPKSCKVKLCAQDANWEIDEHNVAAYQTVSMPSSGKTEKEVTTIVDVQ